MLTPQNMWLIHCSPVSHCDLLQHGWPSVGLPVARNGRPPVNEKKKIIRKGLVAPPSVSHSQLLLVWLYQRSLGTMTTDIHTYSEQFTDVRSPSHKGMGGWGWGWGWRWGSRLDKVWLLCACVVLIQSLLWYTKGVDSCSVCLAVFTGRELHQVMEPRLWQRSGVTVTDLKTVLF